MKVILPPKPRFMDRCNGCGVCCAEEVCCIGALVYPGAAAPCPGLKITPDGSRTYCEVIALEIAADVPPIVRAILGVGFGCTMPDQESEHGGVIYLPERMS